MEFQTQPSNASSSSSSSSSSTYPYMTPPTSPKEYSRCSSMEFYHSAPTSPRHPMAMTNPIAYVDNNHHHQCDNFEFETSKKWDSCRHAVDSPLPSMAFADELFLNGLVMPLKLPPGLRSDGDRSTVTSPKSPRSTTVCRIPTFGRKNSWWNDDFDPFAMALRRVSEEERRGRNSHHRRSRSYSPLPFRANDDDQELCEGRSNSTSLRMEPMQVGAVVLSHSGPLDFKGSGYARWVRAQMREGLSPKVDPSWSVFGRRVWPLKMEPGKEKGNKLSVKKGECEGVNEGSRNKVEKLKGFLLRYASFGGSKQKKATGSEARKNPSYFSRLSFRFKGNNSLGNGKKMVADDGAKMAVVEYKPSIAVCLGYGVGSPNYKVK